MGGRAIRYRPLYPPAYRPGWRGFGRPKKMGTGSDPVPKDPSEGSVSGSFTRLLQGDPRRPAMPRLPTATTQHDPGRVRSVWGTPRPLRAAQHAGRNTGCQADSLQLLFGYDLLLVLGHRTPPFGKGASTPQVGEAAPVGRERLGMEGVGVEGAPGDARAIRSCPLQRGCRLFSQLFQLIQNVRSQLQDRLSETYCAVVH